MPKVFGVLASIMSSESETLQVYTCPEAHFVSATITVVNTGELSALLSLAICQASTPPAASEWIEHELPLSQGQGIERSGIILGEGNSIWVLADSAAFAVNIFGIEQPVE